MKRPISPSRRWTPSKSRKLSFGFKDVAAIAAVLAFVAAFWFCTFYTRRLSD
jgi:hypothetical protein